jgi:arginyl-tRNA synthetase
MESLRNDLRRFGVNHEVWFSERSLVDAGAVESVLERLSADGLAYLGDGALWFASTRHGDDRDRVLRKSDGSLTYFASDIAYHADKFRRGFEEVWDVWGADHHGYVARMKAAVAALGRDPEKDFGVVLIQLVNLLRDGEQVPMSTRSGDFVSLADVLDEVGVDAARFMFLSRKSDSPLDFDLALVRQRNMENPVYYVQYAHARVRALLRRAGERGIVLPEYSSRDLLAPLTGPEDQGLLKILEHFPDAVRDAALARAAHGISFYLMELSGKLHSYYAGNPVLDIGNEALTRARLALLRAVGTVLVNGLELLGVSAPGSM